MTAPLFFKPINRVGDIDRLAFQRDYFSPKIPLVMDRLAQNWGALSRWTPEFFREEMGHKSVKVYDEGFVDPGSSYMSGVRKMPLSEYVDQVLNTEQDLRMFLYNIRSEMPELMGDIDFPDLADGFSKNFVFFFCGCRGSVTQMHFDIDMSHVFHTNLHGRRTITLYPYEQGGNLHRFPFTCRSYVDVDAPDFERFRRLSQAEGYRVTLEPGQTLFIPAGYWHHVVYDEPGYALSLRCANNNARDRLLGIYNLLVMQTIDRVMNWAMPARWFAWKARQASVMPAPSVST